MNKLFTFLISSLLLLACDDVDRTPINLDGSLPEPTGRSVRVVDELLEEIANGVFIKVPDGFIEARSYDGFQYINGVASISLEIRDHGLERIERMFTDKALSARKEELLEYHPVDYFGNEDAFFTATKAKRKGIYKFLLSVEREGRTYNIKALCSFGLGDHLNMYDKLKKALLTTEIREYQAEATDFVAVEGALDGEVFTRDGKYPTASPDEAVIKGGFAIIADGEDNTAIHTKIAEQLKEITGEDQSRFRTVPLSNGRIVHATANSDSLHAFMAIIYAPDEPIAKQFIGTATTSEAIDNIKTFVLESSTKRQVGIR